MATSSSSASVESKEREDRILAAKKKLKTYRAKQAKQAEMERAKRNSISLTAAQAKRASANIALAVESKIVQAARDSQDSMHAFSFATPPPSATHSHARNHSRTHSRAGHGRGHSRTGSISITADSMASTAVNALASSLQSPYRNSTSTPSSATPLAHSANTRPTSFVASSRRHSRNLSIHQPSRPLSGAALGAASSSSAGNANILAVERGPDAFGPSGKPSDWQDVDEAKLQPAFALSPSVTPKAQPKPLDDPQGIAGSQSADSFLSHSRRPSRHSRKASLATKRESMEIMGGLGFPSSVDSGLNSRASRRFSSNRHSGIQSASLLFGGGDSNRRSGVRDFDWRGSYGNPSERDVDGDDGGDDRRTALEKLEGKKAGVSSPHTPSDRRHSRQSSVQLPTFDEIHGEEGMDRRSTINLLEANERSTEEQSIRSNATLLSPNVGMTSSQSLPELSAQKSPRTRPASLFISTDNAQAEGLTTLVEEEEEDETNSPLKERKAMDFIKGIGAVEDEAAQQRRREAELETAQRTRRLGLQPKPLKLKSRPTSLYVASSVQRAAGLPQLNESSGDADDEETDTVESQSSLAPSESLGELSRGWSMPRSQSSEATKKLNRRSMPLGSLRPLNMASAVARINAIPEAQGDDPPSPPNTSNRPGMRALRLGSQSSTGSVSSDGTVGNGFHTPGAKKPSSTSRSADAVSPVTNRRSSIIYKPSSSSPTTPNEISLPASSSSSSISTSASASTMAIIDELKAKNLRDTGTLEMLRGQVDAANAQLKQETERAALEYSQLEQRMAEEKRALTSRIDELESAHQERLAQLEQEKEAGAAEMRQQMEDLEAERDMLADDVDGWRTRCTGLEKSLRDERANTESERQRVASLHLHIKSLQARMRQEGLEVASTPTGSDDSPSRSLTIPADVIMALKSPALDPNAPPSSSYFPPGASSSELPNPQTVKLLKDMRQQIFNLAGSLEHERREHLRAQKEADELKDQNSQLTASLENEKTKTEEHKRERTASISATQREMAAAVPEDEEEAAFSPMDASQSESVLSPVAPSPSSRNKRHVFAYDSSMGSMDQSSMMSAGSGTTMATSMAESEQGSLTPDEKQDGSVLPGGLQPLAEAEEVEEEVAEVEEQESEMDGQEQQHARGGSIIDLEAGEDIEEASSDEQELAPEIYDTPSLEPSATFASAASSPAQVRSQAGDRNASVSGTSGSQGSKSSGDVGGQRSSTTSSVETYGPASPVDLESGGVPHDEQDDYDDQQEEDYDDDSLHEDASDHVDMHRPEFIREWSYRDALDAVRNAQSKNGLRQRTKQAQRSRKPSIDDFFGLLVCEQLDPLPALPSTHSSLDMPPVYVEYYDDDDAARDYASVGRRGSNPPVRQAMIAGSSSFKGGRPPVARSAYVRDSSQSSLDSGLTRSNSGTTNSTTGRSYSSNSDAAQFSSPDRDAGRGSGSNLAMAAAGGLGSRALGRVSLQGLTSAFSGLGGYLAGQSGAAVHAAATATTMCAKGDGYDSRNPSVSLGWQGQQYAQQPGAGALKSIVGTGGAKRFSSALPGSPTAAYGRSSMSSQGSQTAAGRTPTLGSQQQLYYAHQHQQPEKHEKQARGGSAQRRYLTSRDIAPPQPSPIWRLDFLGATDGWADAFTV
ncbi:hypothetical protein BDZ90DRAFT_258716 [Jaminaea rosea]|uniref:Uncharacterized protein n=1 Tax=Jaminaea rosea TaxID=1569628 RepID=A0A316UXU8_9BASI|nr:hypothetical protein BDZ90DRAFT_258716 [Jaminaea rosea]PWN29814.1 hypothetical protein BDZ90DRAFT_258716 [Jaminaea rosea]